MAPSGRPAEQFWQSGIVDLRFDRFNDDEGVNHQRVLVSSRRGLDPNFADRPQDGNFSLIHSFQVPEDPFAVRIALGVRSGGIAPAFWKLPRFGFSRPNQRTSKESPNPKV